KGVGLDADRHQLCYWVLDGVRLVLTYGRGGTGSSISTGVNLVNLNKQYVGTAVKASEAFLGEGSRLRLPSGPLQGSGTENVELVKSSVQSTVQHSPMAAVTTWTSAGSGPWTISDDNGGIRITIKDCDAGPWASLTNTVPQFDMSNVLDHFRGIYEALEKNGSTV